MSEENQNRQVPDEDRQRGIDETLGRALTRYLERYQDSFLARVLMPPSPNRRPDESGEERVIRPIPRAIYGEGEDTGEHPIFPTAEELRVIPVEDLEANPQNARASEPHEPTHDPNGERRRALHEAMHLWSRPWSDHRAIAQAPGQGRVHIATDQEVRNGAENPQARTTDPGRDVSGRRRAAPTVPDSYENRNATRLLEELRSAEAVIAALLKKYGNGTALIMEKELDDYELGNISMMYVGSEGWLVEAD